MAKKTNSLEPESYLHGYSKKEQKRLKEQAEILEPYVYDFVDLKKQKKLLEVGCGVGAQTRILLKKYPQLRITGVDISAKQLEMARHNLIKYKSRVTLIQGDGKALPVEDSDFDSAFVCWFLEHVPDPLRVLKQIHTKLKAGSVIYCTEVQNSSLFVHPYSPAILKYWFEVNDLQWSDKGHPFVGAQLGNLLKSAGYKDIVHSTQNILLDNRNPKIRKKMIAYFTELFLSIAPQLLKKKRVTPKLVKQMKAEMKRLAETENSVFYFAFCRAKARR